MSRFLKFPKSVSLQRPKKWPKHFQCHRYHLTFYGQTNQTVSKKIRQFRHTLCFQLLNQCHVISMISIMKLVKSLTTFNLRNFPHLTWSIVGKITFQLVLIWWGWEITTFFFRFSCFFSSCAAIQSNFVPLLLWQIQKKTHSIKFPLTKIMSTPTTVIQLEAAQTKSKRETEEERQN